MKHGDVGTALGSDSDEARGGPIHNLFSAARELFSGPGDLDNLSEDELADRAFTKKQRESYRKLQRDCENAHHEIVERASAELERAGREYRRKLESEIVREVVNPDYPAE